MRLATSFLAAGGLPRLCWELARARLAGRAKLLNEFNRLGILGMLIV